MAFNPNPRQPEQRPPPADQLRFIVPNPATPGNPVRRAPRIHPSAYVGPFSCVIGDVTVEENVFIAPGVIIRADEGHPFFIGAGTNLQDGVTLHALAHGNVTQDGQSYSIYIGRQTNCTHGCLVHGPCKIGDRVFVGFRTIVFSATVGDGCYISPNAIITGGVTLPANRFVPAAMVVDTQAKADNLPPTTQTEREFSREVQQVNAAFPAAYRRAFGG